MNKFVVVTFADETKAYEGTRALKELNAEGSLTLYGMAVVAKDATGKLSVKQSATQGPIGMGVGALLGGLAGLLAGPVGVAIGASGGAVLGSLRDHHNLGVTEDFIETVSQDLKPGKVAVLAEVSEDWVTPLDTRMHKLGGSVVRELRAHVEDERARLKAAARKAELAHLKEELEQATEENKAKLKARIEELQARAEAASQQIETRIDQLQQQTDAKLGALEQQAAKATGTAKAKLERRIAELRATNERRSEQLRQAWDLTKEALRTKEEAPRKKEQAPRPKADALNP